jgi:RNA polymerase sigma factor (sigma-70 family)
VRIKREPAGELLRLEETVWWGPPDEAPAPAAAAGYAATDFDTFYRAEITGLVILARALAGPAVAEDVAQEAMLVVYRRWHEVRNLASPVGWARRVCLHKAVSVVRRRTRERTLLRKIGAFRAASTDTSEDERFWAAVRTLPARQAETVALYYGLDLSVEDVASTLGCAEGTVKSHLSRARATLATSWELQEDPS